MHRDVRRKIEKGAALLLVLLGLSAAPAWAQVGGTGIGGQIGDPTGVTLKFYNPGGMSYDFLAAWDFDDDFFFLNLHGLYERPLPNTGQLRFFYGPGVFVGFRDRGGDDDVALGISGSLGLSYYLDRLEFFAQVTPRFLLTPATDGDVGGGIGLRFYL